MWPCAHHKLKNNTNTICLLGRALLPPYPDQINIICEGMSPKESDTHRTWLWIMLPYLHFISRANASPFCWKLATNPISAAWYCLSSVLRPWRKVNVPPTVTWLILHCWEHPCFSLVLRITNGCIEHEVCGQDWPSSSCSSIACCFTLSQIGSAWKARNRRYFVPFVPGGSWAKLKFRSCVPLNVLESKLSKDHSVPLAQGFSNSFEIHSLS